jgi:BlaI family penicillinase repressor
MTSKNPKISDAEWEVMRTLWATAPRTSAEIVAEVVPRTHWKPNTIKTLLARLVKKGAVSASGSGRDYSYSPLFTETQCVRAASRSIASRISDGSLMPLIAGFLQHERLSREEIQRLRKLLDELEKRSDQ